MPGVIINDSVPEANTPETSEPTSYKKKNLELSAGYAASKNLSLKLAFEDETWDRHERDVKETSEDIWKLAVDYKPSVPFLSLVRFGYKTADKEIVGAYTGHAVQNPDLRKFDEAGRDRKELSLLVKGELSENASGTLSYGLTDNDYSGTYGRTDDELTNWTLSLDYAVNPKNTIAAMYSNEKFKANMRSRYRTPTSDNALDDWTSNAEDTVDTFELSVASVIKPDKMDAEAYLSISDGDGKVVTTPVTASRWCSPASATCNGGGTFPAQFPDTSYKLTEIGLNLNCKMQKNVTGKLFYQYYKYEQTDFAIDDMEPYMVSVDTTVQLSTYLGAKQPDYKAHVFGGALEYKF